MSQPPSGFRPGQHLEILDDPIHDPYRARLKLTSPTVCSECGALYADGRWQWAQQVPPGAAQLDMMAALQPWVDQAIAKTVRIPAGLSLDDCRGLYGDAWRQCLKGCTMYRSATAEQAARTAGCGR